MIATGPTLRSGAPGTTVPFSPTDLAGLQVWLVSNDAPLTGQSFPEWNDHRGAGFPKFFYANSISAERVENALNGYRIIRCLASGSNPRYDGNTWCAAMLKNVASAMLIATWKPLSSAAGRSSNLMIFSNAVNGGSARLAMQARQDANDVIGVYRRTDAESANLTTPTARHVGAWSIHGVVMNWQAGTALLTDNGTEVPSTYLSTTGLTENTNSLNVVVFGLLTGVTTYGDMEVAEIILQVPAGSTSDRQKTEGYMAWKYALTGLLPAGHPYKTVAP